MGLRLKKDKAIKKEDYKNKEEFKFDKKTDLVPSKNDKLLIIILSETKGAIFLYRKFDKFTTVFRFNKGKYFIENEAIYTTRNGTRTSVYIEGVSLPLKTKYVEKILKKVKYVDIDGTQKETEVQVPKGLRFDAKIFDTFSNREFAEVFTKPPQTKLELFIIILTFVSVIICAVNSILIYYYCA